VPLSALVGRLLAAEGVLVLAETAGSAVPAPGAGRDRDLAAIVRDGLTGRLRPGEVAVPGTALTAVSPLTGRAVVDELLARSGLAPLAFLSEYARVLLPPLLRLLAGHGIAVEAHLQNSIVTFTGGRPARLVLRDMAGLRLHRPRLADAGHDPRCWPGSVVVADDLDVVRAKLAYTALQAHLGELVVHLTDRHGVDEAAAWATVGGVVDGAYRDGPGGAAATRAAAADRRWLTGAALPHKALVRMRLDPGGGDRYVAVANPLAGRPTRGAPR
jgi:siderophore synthetase component